METGTLLKSVKVPSRNKYGERFLNTVFDEVSVTDPDRLFASISLSTDVTEGFKDLSFRDISRCVNNFACFLEREIGSSSKAETIAYLGLPDLRNVIVFLAAVKCGYKLLLLSPRNQPSTSVSLLEQTQCNTLLYAREMAPIFKTMEPNHRSLKGIQVGELDELLQQGHEPVKYDKKSEDTMRTPILVLHSSGSTGVPKPITMTHGTFATFDNCRNLPPLPGRRNNDFTMWDSSSVRRFYSAFPPSHLAGFLSMIIVPIFSETSCPVLGPPLRPPSGQLVKEIMEKQNLKSLFVPPAVADQILQEPSGLDFFSNLDFMYTAGGPLSQSAGDRISAVTSVCQLYGSTETSQIPMLVPLPEDWGYMEFQPSVKLTMRPLGSEGGVCELVLHTDDTTEKITAFSHNLPGLESYETRDLFMPHATKPGLWRFHGRIDDVIVLGNSEKFLPVPMETKLSSHRSLSGALVLGQGRFQAALLLEPKVAVTDVTSFVDELWPLIEEANTLVPGQGRITRSKVLMASADKPFQRAPKGTVVRSLTLKAYEEEIDALYTEKIPEYSSDMVPRLRTTFELSTIESWIRSIVVQAFPTMQHASNTDDMFVLGLDSLKAIDMLRMFKAALGSHKKPSELVWLSSMTIYTHPNIKQLSAVMASYLNSDETNGGMADNDSTDNRGLPMEALFRKYTLGFKKGSCTIQRPSETGYVVAVTGTTGSLGLQILRQLSRNPRVTKILCLNRGQAAQEKHRQLDEAKFEYITIKLGSPNLGLSQDLYGRLNSEVDVIIHNAWKVDFSQILESYEAEHIRGVRALIDLSLSSSKRPRILFISSISSVSNLAALSPGMPIPEALVDSNDAPTKMGYAESKFVAERILGAAANEAKVPISILRVGQIAGSTIPGDSPWPVQEWFPSLVQTSKALGLLPNDLPPADWVPINKLAQMITEIMLHDMQSEDLEVYILVNPHPVPWRGLMAIVKDRCGPETKESSLEAWIQRLRDLPESAEEVKCKPALKMREFFERMANGQLPSGFATERAQSVSGTMASLEPINADWLRIWLDQWGF